MGYGICIPTTTTTTTNPCLANNGGCSNQRTCQYKNGQKSCGPCPNGYYANGATTCEKDSPCKTNNGGCKGGRTCTAVKQTVTCGPCPKGYHAKGTNDCEKTPPPPHNRIVFSATETHPLHLCSTGPEVSAGAWAVRTIGVAVNPTDATTKLPRKFFLCCRLCQTERNSMSRLTATVIGHSITTNIC